MSVPMAIALSGQPLLGLPVMVKPSDAEKNVKFVAAAAAGARDAKKLYAGDLHFSLKEEQLHQSSRRHRKLLKSERYLVKNEKRVVEISLEERNKAVNIITSYFLKEKAEKCKNDLEMEGVQIFALMLLVPICDEFHLQSEPNFYLDIEEDIEDECLRFGCI